MVLLLELELEAGGREIERETVVQEDRMTDSYGDIYRIPPAGISHEQRWIWKYIRYIGVSPRPRWRTSELRGGAGRKRAFLPGRWDGRETI
jgi:hypothetical protein